MAWNIEDAWPETNKTVVQRRVKELQRRSKTVEELAEARRKKIERLHRQLAELEAEDEKSA